MTNTQILIKALEKANVSEKIIDQIKINLRLQETFFEAREHYKIIFDIEIAKKFWGEEKIKIQITPVHKYLGYEIEKYKYHLQNMVIEKEPLKYIKKFL